MKKMIGAMALAELLFGMGYSDLAEDVCRSLVDALEQWRVSRGCLAWLEGKADGSAEAAVTGAWLALRVEGDFVEVLDCLADVRLYEPCELALARFFQEAVAS
jgi:hypothetical protein